jgi:uncharacterized membrane protein
MIGVEQVYALVGLMFAAVAVLSARDGANPRRWGNAAFWGLVAMSFLFGGRIGGFANGLLVIALALIAGLGGLGQGRPATTSLQAREASASKLGDRLFLPTLIVPAVSVIGSLTLKSLVVGGHALVAAKDATLVSLAIGVIAALAVAMPMLKAPALAPLQEGRKLMDTVGWAALLPQTLAALGTVFAAAGVGKVVGRLIGEAVPLDTPLAAVCAYTIGMAAFTIVMGNAFAAFPVMTAAIGLPLIVHRFGGDPAVMGAIGMLSGFCGTLVTPMAANFNLVPAALLEIPDRWAVIRAQAPTAFALLIINTVLMYLLAFRT